MNSQILSDSPGSPVTASVCICTFRRPGGLRALLHSLAAQVESPDFEVVVMDNDKERSAHAVTLEFSGELRVTYGVVSERGLANARNQCVRAARGEFLAFVDDDETVAPTWLASHHRTLLATGASAVFGPVAVTFEANTPEPIRRCRFFAYPHYSEGDAIPWYYTRTSNACVRRSALPDAQAPFSASFNSTGGEDIDFFKRIADAGGTFVAAGAGALTTEFRERARANMAWALRRSLRNGGNLADLQWAGFSRGQRIRLALTSLGLAVRHSFRALTRYSRSELPFLEQCIDAAENAGRSLSVLGYRYPEYGKRT